MRVAAAALAAVVLAGCGGGSSSAGPKDAALSYARAIEAGDFEKACGYLMPDLRATVEAEGSQHGQTHCEALERISPSVDVPRVGNSHEDGDKAEVEIDGAGDSALAVMLVRKGGRWLVDDVRTP